MSVCGRHLTRISIFREFLSDKQLDEPRLNQWELTYVNHIPAGDGWQRHGELGSVVPLFAGCTKGRPRPNLRTSRCGFGFQCRTETESYLGYTSRPTLDSTRLPATHSSDSHLRPGVGATRVPRDRWGLGWIWVANGSHDVLPK